MSELSDKLLDAVTSEIMYDKAAVLINDVVTCVYCGSTLTPTKKDDNSWEVRCNCEKACDFVKTRNDLITKISELRQKLADLEELLIAPAIKTYKKIWIEKEYPKAKMELDEILKDFTEE